MTLLKKVYSFYSNKDSVEVCQKFFEDPKNTELLEKAYDSVLPILGIIVRNHFKTVQDDDLDDLIQMGAWEYWRLLHDSDPKPRPFSTSAHFNLYYKVGIRGMLKALNETKSRQMDFLANNALPPVASCNFRSPEQEIFVNELPNIIYEAVVQKLLESKRFTGAELDICKYLARCMVNREEIQRFQIRKIGGKVTNADFFEQYVDLLLRDVLQDFRENSDIRSILSDEGAALNENYYKDDGPKDRYRD